MCGKFAAVMSEAEMNTYMSKLGDLSLERWLEFFDSIIEKEDWQGADLNEMIESIDWED